MNFPLPELGEGVYEAEVVQWLVKPGQAVTRGQTLLQVLTDKATMDVPAPFAGTVTALNVEPGQKVQVGHSILEYQTAGGAVVAESKNVEKKVAESVKVAANGPPHHGQPAASPSVRHLARKLGLDLKAVRGSGPSGRILLDDLTPHLQSPAERKEATPPALFDLGVAGTRVKLVGVRRAIADHMVKSTQTIPHYSYVDECDVSELVRLRESLREATAARGVKLTYLAFFIKAAAEALKEVPLVNATLNESTNEIVMHDRYHIGFAATTSRGLLVPVVRDVDQKDIFTVAREVEKLTAAARDGTAKPDELRGGTFTVTSIGGVGGLIATPIIHAPQVGILGLGKVVKRPVYDDAGQLRPADLIYLSLSFDHRVVDGAVGAVFGNAIIRRMRNPAAMLLPGV